MYSHARVSAALRHQADCSGDVAHTPRKPRVASGIPAAAASRPARYIRSIMALPKPEQETWVAPGMSRAKS